MSHPNPDETVERERLIFGAGFALGVTFTMLILGMVLSTVAPQSVTITSLLDSRVLLPVVAAVVFAFVVGVALYLLALPEQGFGIPRRVGFDTDERDDEH
ncbi:hypothetical protein ACFR9U_05080 [Halorientalis brevis]|uniref:Cox cluster protein n=1 Tax=Halorientalis brevis TaxID=1126241 RepID=A0ABD6CAB1_9EURY|nr:hypothetical protein [Halorientalis brevis]